MDKKELTKKMIKAGGKGMANVADRNIGNGDSTADEVGKGIKDTAKNVASTGKVAAKAASGNWAGAIKEFLKNPGGVLVTITAPILALILVVVCVMSVLVNSIWNVLADKPVSSVVDEYIDDLNFAESNCFYNACDVAADDALKQIQEKVVGLDLGREDWNANKNKNFKDKSSIQSYLGMAYNQMRRYSANGNTYPQYQKVLMGEANVFSLLEDNSNGFNVEYNNAGMTTSTLWQRRTHIVDFNNNNKIYEKYVKKVGSESENIDFSALQDTLDETEKVLYSFTYNNERVNDSGYTFSMFEMIFNTKYDFEKIKELNDGPDSVCGRIMALCENLENSEIKNDAAALKNVIFQMESLYSSVGADAYYLAYLDAADGNNESYSSGSENTVVGNINYWIDYYNDKYVENDKDNLSRIGEDQSYVTDIINGARKERKKAFKDFISNKDFYSKLLKSTVSVTVNDNLPDDYGTYKYNLSFADSSSASKGGKITVENIKKAVEITIDVDICDYDTLAEAFGYKTRDENGNLVDNVELLDWIIKSGGLNKEDVINKGKADREITSKVNESVSEVTTSSELSDESENNETLTALNVDGNSFLWPIDMNAENVSISSRFGERENPTGAGIQTHKGLDIAAPLGTPVAAALPGKVVSSRYSPSYGNVVEIESTVNIGMEKKTIKTLYAHMKSRTVSAGLYVTRGENLIGYVGSTGDSTGPHLHFEVMMQKDDGSWEYINPEKYLNEGYIYYLNSSALTDFDGSLESFFENCKDSGTATAEVLIDAGYTKSSTYWQYKNSVYNIMFCSSVGDSSKLEFFVDKDNIVKNDDGSLKIVEYTSADFDTIDSSIGKNTSKARASEAKYNKHYYAVYCYPNTVVQTNISGYRTNLDYQRMKKGQNFKDFWFGNKVGETVGGLNYMVSDLPYDLSKGSNDSVRLMLMQDTELFNLNLKEKEKALKMTPWNKTDYSCEEFTHLSYAFANIAYGFEVLNLQVSVPDGNGGEHFLTGSDYNTNQYGVYHLNKNKLEKTVTEGFEELENGSEFQLGGYILGNVINEYSYPDYWKQYDENDTSTYPFFVVSVANVFVGQKSGLNIEAPSLYDIFDLDVTGDDSYTDIGSGKTWPLVKSYEHKNEVYSLINNGVVVSSDKDTSQVLIKEHGNYILLKNIVPNDEVVSGYKIGKDTLLGNVPDYTELSCINVEPQSDGSIKEIQPVNAGQYFKIVLSISSRAETSMPEDANGKYNKVLSMMSGTVEEISNNSIKVKAPEDNLIYEYYGEGLEIDSDLISRVSLSNDKVWVYSGSEIGKLRLTNNYGVANRLNVIVYSERNEYDKSLMYYNPVTFFRLLKDESTAARKILIQNIQGKTLSGIILNRGTSLQLKSVVTPESESGADVQWISDNPDLVSVSSNGLITAAQDKYGIANISCVFADGKDGISATIKVNVPEKLVDISISAVVNQEQTKDKTIDESAYEPCNLRILEDGSVIDIEYKNGKAVADFNAYTTNEAAKRTVNWSIVDADGNPNYTFATIDVYGTVRGVKPMSENDILYVRATSTDNIGEATYSEVAIRIVRPLEKIELTPKRISFTLNDESTLTQTVDYSCYPEDATYKSVDITPIQSDVFNAETQGNKITVKSTGAAGTDWLMVKSKHYPNISSQCSVEASMLVDYIVITEVPTDVISGETYTVKAVAYYKNKEVPIENGLTLEWEISAPTLNRDAQPSIVNGQLRIPQIVGDKANISITAKINNIKSKTVKINAYPFFAFDGKSSDYFCYINNSEKEQNVFVRRTEFGQSIYKTYSPSAIPSGKTLYMNRSIYSGDITYKIIAGDGIEYVSYGRRNEITFNLKNGYTAGNFKVRMTFPDGKIYEREFNVS